MRPYASAFDTEVFDVAISTSGSKKARDTLAFLRARIMSGDWAVGSRIPKEPELMELMGVGKSTVREAVRSLAHLGMLEAVPGVGTFVRSRTPVSSVVTDFLNGHDLEEVLVYRRSLEIEAAQRAAVQRTEEHITQLREAIERARKQTADETASQAHVATPGSFHHVMFEAANSTLLLDLYLGTMSVLRQASNENRVIAGTSSETILHDHEAVFEAIKEKDVRHAAHAMALHVDRDLVLWDGTLTMDPQTKRATTLIDAGFDPAPPAPSTRPTPATPAEQPPISTGF